MRTTAASFEATGVLLKKTTKKVFSTSSVLYMILMYGVFVLALGIFRGETSIGKFFELRQSREVLRKAIADLETENSNIQEEISKIRKSAVYARKVLRDKYHVTEENERVVFLGTKE